MERGNAVKLDLDGLIRTRLLVQANSGGGKSWLLRRLAEQLFGRIPVLIIDPEGEFATLREHYGYVLVGQGGETPADIRSAELVAQRLLELGASAVCDLYESFRGRPNDRRLWVKLFLDALIDAPKKFWKPLIVIVDEAHKFCPQETPKAGSQEERRIIVGCKEAMISLATTGRKRGFCAIWATQRLAKLDKDASAELLNRLIGPTFEDVDVERAFDLLSVGKEERKEFRQTIRVLAPGHFYAIGRAVSAQRILFAVGTVKTTHPEMGSAGYAAAPPPPPELVKALLPKLQDLPKEAEERARTVAELRQEVVELRRALRQAKQTVPSVKTETKEISVIQPAELTRLEKHIAWFDKIRDRMTQAQQVLTTEFGLLADAVKRASQAPLTVSPSRPFGELPVPSAVPPPVRLVPSGGSNELESGQLRILETIGMLNTRQIPVTREAVARWMGIHPNGGRYNRGLAQLREHGYLEGWRIAKPLNFALTQTGPHAVLGSLKDQGQRRVFASILESKAALTREELATRLGIHPNGGRFNRSLAWFRDMGIIPDRGPITPTEGVFR